MPFLGAHMPTAGGLHRAFAHIRTVKGEALQLFTRNQRQWSAPAISEEEAAAFAAAWAQWPFPHVFSHASYLINPASPDEELWRTSMAALAAELTRCARLSIPFAVLHPGAHKDSGRAAGIARAAACLDAAFAEAGDAAGGVGVLLENTAGSGTTLGADPAELGDILAASRHPERLGVCWDTCHGFAAGFDPRTPETWNQTIAALDAAVSLPHLRLLHLNDSMHPLGSRKDRHEHIGQGCIGLTGFRTVLTDPRLANLPMCLETPKDPDLRQDIANLRTLRRLLKPDEA